MNLPQIQIEPAPLINIPRYQNYMMTVKERGVLITLLRELRTETFVEIGINQGLCAEVLLAALPTLRRYVGVDVEPGYIGSNDQPETNVPEIPAHYALGDHRLEVIVRPRGSFDLTPEDLPICDAMLIDGDHGTEAVVWDTQLAKACVRKGGLILWHDYYLAEQIADDKTFNNNSPDVSAVLNGWFADGMDIKHIEDTWLAVMRR